MGGVAEATSSLFGGFLSSTIRDWLAGAWSCRGGNSCAVRSSIHPPHPHPHLPLREGGDGRRDEWPVKDGFFGVGCQSCHLDWSLGGRVTSGCCSCFGGCGGGGDTGSSAQGNDTQAERVSNSHDAGSPWRLVGIASPFQIPAGSAQGPGWVRWVSLGSGTRSPDRLVVTNQVVPLLSFLVLPCPGLVWSCCCWCSCCRFISITTAPLVPPCPVLHATGFLHAFLWHVTSFLFFCLMPSFSFLRPGRCFNA